MLLRTENNNNVERIQCKIKEQQGINIDCNI